MGSSRPSRPTQQIRLKVLVQGPADDLSWIYAITVRQVSERFGHAPRSVGESLALRILAERNQRPPSDGRELFDWQGAGRLGGAHSHMTSAALFSDSVKRRRTNRAGAKWGASLVKAAKAMFSAVGTIPLRHSTSRLRCLWSTRSMNSRLRTRSTSLRLATIPVSGSTAPATVTS